MEERKEAEFSSYGLMLFLWNWRKPIIIVCGLAAIVSAIVSLVIEEKYKSTVVMFPAKTSSVSKSLLQESVNDQLDFMGFGEEEESEQLLQILNSDDIRDRIIQLYDLWHHYKIDEGSKGAYTKMRKEFESNISFMRTKFGSVRVDVLDVSPDTAALIANNISALLDTAKNKMLRERAGDGLKIVEDQYFKERAIVQVIRDSLKTLGERGVNDFESQSEVLNQQYAIALGRGDNRAVKALKSQLDTLAKYGSTALALTQKLEFKTERLADLEVRWMQAKADADAVLTHKFVVNRAFPADKKTYPVRWLIVVMSTISAFILMIFTVLALENYRKLRAGLKKA